MNAPTRKTMKRSWTLLLLLVMTGCGQTEGCSGPAAPYPATGLKVDRAVQLHITEEGLNTIEASVVPLLASQIGGDPSANGFSFCLKKTTEEPIVCGDNSMGVASLCADQTLGCQLDFTVDDVQINPLDNGDGTALALGDDGVQVRVVLGEMDEIVPFEQDFVQCDFHVWLEPGQTISFQAEIEMPINPSSDLTEIRLVEAGTTVDVEQLNIESNGFCALANIPEIQGFVKDRINLVLRPIIADAAEDALCRPCEADPDCPSTATCDLERNLCFSNSNPDVCISRDLGLEGYFELGSLLADVTPGLEAGIYYSAFAANYADSQNTTDRLSLGLQAGFTSDHNDCVNYVDPPSAQGMLRSLELESTTTPSGELFDVGIGISKRALDHALWALYNSGVLCLEVGTSTIDQISTAALAPFLPGLRRLTGGDSNPAKLKLFPNKPPVVRFGSGELVAGSDPPMFVDPPINIVIEDLDVDLYAFVFGRYARMFTINTDVEIGLGVLTTPNNEIEIVLGNTDNIFQNITVRNNELTSDDVSRIESLLPTLVQVAVPLLLSSIAEPIPLPDLLGFKFNLVQVAGIGDNTMLGIFADFEYDPNAAGGLSHALETTATLRRVDAPIAEHLLLDGTLSPYAGALEALAPRVILDVAAARPAGETRAIEYSYRVGGSGFWSAFTQGDTLEIEDTRFLMQGEYDIEVRSRLLGAHDTLDPTPAALRVLIDWAPPIIHDVTLEGSTTAVIHAEDVIDLPEALTFRHRVDHNAWSDWRAEPVIDLAAHEGHQVRVEVEARDRSGHTSRGRHNLHVRRLSQAPADLGAPRAPAATDSGGGWACSTTPTTTTTLPMSSSLPALSALLGLLLLGAWRRRRALLPVAAVALAALGLGGCDDDTSTETPACTPGVDADCPCDADDQCQEGEVCRSGACGPADSCADDSQCQEGQVCEDSDGDGALDCSFPACGSVDDCDPSACAGGNIVKCFEGACICEMPCVDGCPEGEYCCNQEDRCMALPEECLDHACDPGFVPVVSAAGSPDPNTCMVSDPVCDCESLPPLVEGIHGVHSDLDAANNLIAHSSYNRTYGDLMLGLSGPDGVMTWEYLDGVPDGAEVEGAIDGPRGGIGDAGEDVGAYSGVAVAADGTLHISYQDVDAGALKYARGVPVGDGTFTWSMHLVDEAGETGLWTDITLDPSSGAPAISYVTASIDRGDGGLVSQLRIAYAASDAPATAADWTLATIDEMHADGPCEAICENDDVCRIDLGVCEALAPDTEPCTVACGAGEQCFSGDVCATTHVRPSGGEWPYLVAIHAEQLRAPDGLIAIAYHDGVLGRLMVARESAAGTFDPPVVVEGGAGMRTGLWPSLAFDDSGNPHYAFVSVAPRHLLYRDDVADIVEIVDDGRRDDPVSGAFTGAVPIGANARLWFEGGAPRIAYQDAGALTINLATRGGADSWSREPIAGDGRGAEFIGSFGFYIDHVVLGGAHFVVNMVANMQVEGRPIVPSLLLMETP